MYKKEPCDLFNRKNCIFVTHFIKYNHAFSFHNLYCKKEIFYISKNDCKKRISQDS